MEGFRSPKKKYPRNAKKTRQSRIDVDPSRMLLGPSNGICSNLLKCTSLLVHDEDAH